MGRPGPVCCASVRSHLSPSRPQCPHLPGQPPIKGEGRGNSEDLSFCNSPFLCGCNCEACHPDNTDQLFINIFESLRCLFAQGTRSRVTLIRVTSTPAETLSCTHSSFQRTFSGIFSVPHLDLRLQTHHPPTGTSLSSRWDKPHEGLTQD